MKSNNEITSAARLVVAERLATGVSTAYVIGILERDPAWADLPMPEYSEVRAEAAAMLAEIARSLAAKAAA
jgi:hypothetical protein